MQLDNRMKQLLRELGRAINEAVSESDRIAESISRIRGNGYEVFLMLDAVVGLSKQTSAAVETSLTGQDKRFLKSLKIRLDDESPEPETTANANGKTAMTPQDLKFLRSLRINVDDLQ